MASLGHRHSGSTSTLGGRRPVVVTDAFSLNLPRAVPKLVLPPTPTSPDGGKDGSKDYATLSWRPRTPSSPRMMAGKKVDLPPTPPSSDACSLPPSSPPSLVFDELPPALPPKASNAADNSYNGILKKGYPLHTEFVENYMVLEELGSGGYGVVVRAIRHSDEREVAVKLMWAQKVPSDNWVLVPGWDARQPNETCRVPREAFILRSVRCDGVVGFVDLFSDDNFVYLVMEYFGSPWNSSAPVQPFQSAKLFRTAAVVKQIRKIARPAAPARKGSVPLIQPPSRPEFVRRSSCDLFECLEQHDYMPENLARGIFRQIVDSVAHLHARGVIHCDLKDENIVIDANYQVKLIDFGSAIVLARDQPVPFQQHFRGTVNYAPPEVVKGLAFQAPQAEIWALGCVLSLLLTGKSPFTGPDAIVKAQISEPAIPMSRLAWDLMGSCLRYNPAERATIFQIQEHAWFSES